MRRLPRAADRLDVEIALDDAAGLADLAAIHPDEVGRFGGEATRCTVSPACTMPSSALASSWK